jgi:hypothetical protein
MFFSLLVFAASYATKINISSDEYVVKLKPFGFAENGTFSFFVQSKNLDHMKMFLVRRNAIVDVFFSQGKLHSLCSQMQYHVSHTNFSRKIEGHEFSWTGSVPQQGVYTPYLLNCNYQQADYFIEISYQNGRSGLDTREAPLVSMHWTSVCYSIVFLVITTITLYLKKHESKLIVVVFESIGILKVILEMFQCIMWEERKVAESQQTFLFESIIGALSSLFIALILVSVSLVFSGLESYRSSIPVSKLIIIILESLLIAVPIFLSMRFRDELREFILAAVISFLALVFYLKDVLRSFSFLLKLREVDSDYTNLFYPVDGALMYAVVNVFCYGFALIHAILDVIIGNGLTTSQKALEICFIIQFVMGERFLIVTDKTVKVESSNVLETPVFIDSPFGSELFVMN